MRTTAQALRIALILLAAASLVGCGVIAKGTPTPLPTVVLDNQGQSQGQAAAPTAANPASEASATSAPAAANPPAASANSPAASSTSPSASPARSGAVSASAEITPAQSVDLSFSAPCIVTGLSVSEGDEVKAGDILAMQDNLVQLQSALEASRQALVSAQKDYDQLSVNIPLERANAQLALVKAEKALEDAQKSARSKQYQRASQETIDVARARLIQANQALDDAETAFSHVRQRNNEDVVYAAGLAGLAKARQEQVTAQYNLNYVMGLPSPLDIEEADANVAVAQASVLAAKDAWEKIKNGEPDDQQVAAVQAQIAAAQSQLVTAQLALDRAAIRAPFDGSVIAVAAYSGQAVNPGQAVLTLANLKNLQVETTDLSERDVARVKVGQPANVTVDGLGQTFEGTVIKIAPRSTKVGGDVVYKVTIQLNEQPAGLRWGMSASVEIGP